MDKNGVGKGKQRVVSWEDARGWCWACCEVPGQTESKWLLLYGATEGRVQMGLAEKGDKKGGCGNHLGRVHIAGCAVIGGVDARPKPQASTHTAVNRDGEGAGAGIDHNCGWFLRQQHQHIEPPTSSGPSGD